MSTDLERYVAPPPPVRLPTFEVMGPAIELAAQVANTDFVPKALRGKPEAVVAAILQGHELGIEPSRDPDPGVGSVCPRPASRPVRAHPVNLGSRTTGSGSIGRSFTSAGVGT